MAFQTRLQWSPFLLIYAMLPSIGLCLVHPEGYLSQSTGSITRPCDPSVIGSGPSNCTDIDPSSVGNLWVVDLPLSDPYITHPSDGEPWGIHLSGPWPDGVSYLISWYHGDADVGSLSSLDSSVANTDKMQAWVKMATTWNGKKNSKGWHLRQFR